MAVIELVLDGDVVNGNLVLYECSDPIELQRYIQAPRQHILRRIFLVEWSEGGPDIGDAREGTIRRVLQTQVHVPPDLFSEHASHGVGSCFEPREERIINSYLITALSAEQRFCVSFFALFEYAGTIDGEKMLVCGETERQLQFHQWRTREGCLIIAPMKCSYWSSEVNGCWNGENMVQLFSNALLILQNTVFVVVDPAPDKAKELGRPNVAPISLKPREPFLGGYHEFLPRDLASKGALSDVTTKTLGQATEVAVAGVADEAHRVVGSVAPPATMDEPEEIIEPPMAVGTEIRNGSVVEMRPREDLAERERKEALKKAEEGKKKTKKLKQNILADLNNTISPRTSIFDDLRYYFARHSRVLGTLASRQNNSPTQPQPRLDPSTTTLFPLKIIASHYCLLHAFVSFQTASMRSTGWTLKDDTAEQREESQQVEEAWSRFRCSEYLEALEALLDSLGITLYGTSATLSSETTPLLHHIATTQGPPWRSAIAPDFLFLHRQFHMRRHDYDRITTSIAALAGIITGRVGITTGRIAVDEARAAMSLSYVAILFAPLAWVAAVFSMPEEFAPGGKLFWRYWATAVPFMLLVWFLITSWHNRREVRSRAGVVRRNVRGWMGGGDDVV